MRGERADLLMDKTRVESHYHLLLFETGIFGTAEAADNEDDAGRAAAAEGGRCSLGILVTAGGAAAALEEHKNANVCLPLPLSCLSPGDRR